MKFYLKKYESTTNFFKKPLVILTFSNCKGIAAQGLNGPAGSWGRDGPRTLLVNM